jgi:hypothetical protein
VALRAVLPGHLAGIPDEGHAQLIRRFATWAVLPRLRSRADRKPITTYSRRYAGEQVKIATVFLRWLSARVSPWPTAARPM